MKFQEEIIKAQQEQILHQNLMMSNSDESIMLKSFQECLFGSPNKEEFEKSWSSDLQAKFPEGSFKTINGASVFINGGKVIAGLGGFNGAIDEYFSKKDKQSGGDEKSNVNLSSKSTDKEILDHFSKLKNKKVEIGSGKFKRQGEVVDVEQTEGSKIRNSGTFVYFKEDGEEIAEKMKVNFSDQSKFNLINEDKEESKTQDKPKESKEEEKDEPMTEKEQTIFASYKNDKKKFLKDNSDPIVNQPKRMDSLDTLIKETKSSEYRAMLNEVKQHAQDRLDEPKKAESEYREKEKEVTKFLGEDGRVNADKLLEGDVTENFKKYEEYLRAHKNFEKKSGVIAFKDGEFKRMVMTPSGKDPLGGKTAVVKKKDIKIRETDTTSALKDVVGEDKYRPEISGVYNDPEGYKVATSLHSLVAIKEPIDEKEAGKIINPKTKEEIKGNFPNWKAFLPKEKGETKMKLSELNSLSKQAVELQKTNILSVAKIGGIDKNFNPKILNNTIESMRKLGVEDVTVLGNDNRNGGLILQGTNKEGKEVFGMVMPMMVKDEDQYMTITQ